MRLQAPGQDVHARLHVSLPLARPELPERPRPAARAFDRARFARAQPLLATLGGGGASASGPTPVATPDAVQRDPVLALVHRITNGFSREEYEHAQALGYEGYLEEQLHPEAIDDSVLERRLRRYTSLEMSPWE